MDSRTRGRWSRVLLLDDGCDPFELAAVERDGNIPRGSPLERPPDAVVRRVESVSQKLIAINERPIAFSKLPAGMLFMPQQLVDLHAVSANVGREIDKRRE